MPARFLTSKILSGIPTIQHAFLPIDAPLPKGLLLCNQQHSSQIIRVDQHTSFEKQKADGLITNSFQPIGIITVDCLPILITNTSGSCVAAVHGGWKGLKKGIVFEAIKMFEMEHINAKHLRVAIGPSIHPCCYEVGDEVIDALDSSFNYLWKNASPPWLSQQPSNQASQRSRATGTTNGLWLDLARLACLQLQYLGIKQDCIELVGACTYCGASNFASFRRNTHENKSNQFQYSWITKL